MSKSNQPKILFIMTGSIACFKACHLISKLKQKNYDVQVVTTKGALEFVGEATLEGLSGRKVESEVFDRGQMMDHIYLQRWADLILVCPATANYINRISQGIGDDLASTLFLAHDFSKPFLLAPAMNVKMYQHPVTQNSLEKLKQMGVEVLESASGVLACGETGYGRLLEPDQLLAEVEARLGNLAAPRIGNVPKKTNLKALVTAGGTYEPIDTVRVLTNLSTGQTGQNIASYLQEMGFEVDLLLSELAVQKVSNEITTEKFSTFNSLKEKMQTKLKTTDYQLVIHAAAVSDYHIKDVSGANPEDLRNGKIPSGEAITLRLEPNPKIVNEIKKISPRSVVIAFKLTSGSEPLEQKTKVSKLFSDSDVDFVVGNDLKDVLHKKDGHGFALYKRSGEIDQAADIQHLNQKLLENLSPLFLEGKV